MQAEHYDTLFETEQHHWWYRVRRLLVRDLLSRNLQPEPRTRLRVLDVGCGTGALMLDLRDIAEVYGIDASPTAVSYCHQRGLAAVTHATAAETRQPSGFFDVVLLLDVLEHVADEKPALAEARRVLKPGGLLVAFSPAFMALWGVTDELSHHYRRYRLSAFRSLIEDAAFTTMRSSYFNTLLFGPIAAFRLASGLVGRSVQSENRIGGAVVNTLLYWVFRAELPLLRRVGLPFGVSVMVVAKKT